MDTSDKATTVLKQHLQKVLKHVVTGLPQFRKTEVECGKHVVSLANLLGQRRSVVESGSLDSLTSEADGFPDLQARLLVKISAEVNKTVEVLEDLILPLKAHHEHVSRARIEILRHLQKTNSRLDPEALYQGSPTTPPLMVMLGWVDCLERELRELYYARLHYLQNVLDPEVVAPDSLAKLWMQNSTIQAVLQDCEEQTRYFLEATG